MKACRPIAAQFVGSLLLAFLCQPSIAQQAQLNTKSGSTEATITEPGSGSVEGLFMQADTVALVKITAGDAESCDIPIYKAQVVVSFKGAAAGEVIFSGRFVGQRLGWE